MPEPTIDETYSTGTEERYRKVISKHGPSAEVPKSSKGLHTMRYEICSNCGKRFQDTKTVDQRLVAAIFGEKHLCTKCLKDLTWPKCTKCGKPVESPILYNNEPYHSYCSPYSW